MASLEQASILFFKCTLNSANNKIKIKIKERYFDDQISCICLSDVCLCKMNGSDVLRNLIVQLCNPDKSVQWNSHPTF